MYPLLLIFPLVVCIFNSAITIFPVISHRRSLALADMNTTQGYVISTLSENTQHKKWQIASLN